MDFSQVYEGWKNKLLPAEELKEQINQVSQYRISICEGCPFYSENARKQGYNSIRPDIHCIDCGCTISAKTKCLSCSCPKDKWMEVASKNVELEIKHELNEKGT